MSATIRQLNPSEIDAAAELLAHCLQDTFGNLIPAKALAAFSVTRSRSRILEAIDTTLVIEEDGAFVGIGQTRQDEIAFIYLDRTVQRRGLGKALMAALLSNIHKDCHKTAWIYVLDTNKRAREFYRRQGWRKTDAVEIDVNGVTLHHIKCVREV